MSIAARLEELGLELPPVPKPVADYVPWVRSGNTIFVSGQIPIVDGTPLFVGLVPNEVPPDRAATAARLCALNILAAVNAATDENLDLISRVVRLGVYVAATPAFTQHPIIANGASELMIQVFGLEIGQHTRAAIGCTSLPLGVPVEIDAVFEMTT